MDFIQASSDNLLRIRQTLDTIAAGSGINVIADIVIGDRIGLNNINGDPIDPARTQDINNLRLDTARIVQPSGQQPMGTSQSVVWASNAPLLPVSVTVSGQNTMGNSVSVTLASNQSPIGVAIPSGILNVSGVFNQIIPLTASAVTSGNIGVTSSQLVAANNSRRGLAIINVSSSTLSLAFGGGTAIINTGVTLFPNSSFTMDAFSFTLGQVNAIASAAGTAVAVQEWI